MAMISSMIDMGQLHEAEGHMRGVGLQPEFSDLVRKIDFDPDALIAQVDQILQAHDTLDASKETWAQMEPTEGVWTGDTAQGLVDFRECARTFWDWVLDFLLFLVEQVLQIIDYIVDFLRIIVAWITWAATAIIIIVTSVLFLVTLLTGGAAAALTAVVQCLFLGVAGIVAALGAVLSVVLWALNQGIEWLQQQIRDARGSICQRENDPPSLPDWDPEDWEPPAWPV